MIRIILTFIALTFAGINLSAQTASQIVVRADSFITASSEKWEKGDKDNSIQDVKKGMTLLSKINGGNTINMALSEYILGIRLCEMGRHREGLFYLEKSYPRYSKCLPITDALVCQILYGLVDEYENAGLYDKALKMSDVMVAKIRRFHNAGSTEYFNALELSGRIKMKCSQYAQAKDVYEEYLQKSLSFELFDSQSFLDCNAYANLATCQYMLGEFAEAEKNFAIADSLFSDKPQYKKVYFMLLNRRGTNLVQLGETDKAMDCFDRASEIESDKIDENLQLLNLNNQACLLINEDIELAYELFSLLARRCEELGLTNSALYGISKSNMAFCELTMGKTEKGIASVNEGISVLEACGQTNDINYFIALITKVSLYRQAADERGIEDCCKQVSQYVSSQLQKSFPYLTESGRSKFLEQFLSWGGFLLPNVVYEHPTPELTTELYNSLLLTRGILLNSSLNIDRILRHTDDEILSTLYLQYKAARSQKADKAIVERLEKRILENLPSRKAFLDDMRINADSIKTHLSPEDLAVEFVVAENMSDDDSTYYALTLKHDYPAPLLLRLCSVKEAKRLSLGDLSAMYSLIWAKIEDQLHGVKNVYFSADGVLHVLPIEYATDGTGHSVFEKYKCCRLSSTREIAKGRREQEGKGEIVMYGNIDYNWHKPASPTTDIEEAAYSPATDEALDSILVYEAPDSALVNGPARWSIGNFSSLSWTRFELEQISKIWRDNGIKPECIERERATEESVKSFSYKSPRYLHFATHGFYAPWSLTTDVAEDADSNSERTSLSKSALVFAGANYALLEDTVDTDHDGLLTAYEISSLDFSNTDLVVMSACESGLGDISGEGVFGLQRGIKKSGARSMLMTLCKVNDHATALFMKAFYESLANGCSKHQSLLNAQSSLKQAEGGQWSAPIYWAPFVLLDAK